MKLARKAVYLLPLLFCLCLYWQALFAWFQGDDFAFLGLNHDLTGWNSFWRIVFMPARQGTLRPWSERVYFLLFWRIGGLDALPYHACVLLTQFTNLLLLSWIVFRLTASRLAAVLAPILWTANAVLAVSITWACAYNEILCASFLLAAFALLLKFEETGFWRYYWLQTAVFVLGFGALELNIVYPAIAVAWAILRGRRRLALQILPLFALSAAFYLIHSRLTPRQTSGPYLMHFDSALPLTLWTYWQWLFVEPYWNAVFGFTAAPAIPLLTLAVLVFLALEIRARRYTALFFAAWFFITLSPLLPLRDHLSDYYLTVPSLGIAVIFALAAARWKAPSFAAIAIYLAIEIPAARASTRFQYNRTERVRDLVLGVKRAVELHPGRTILLTGVSGELYDNAIYHKPFRLFTDTPVLLASGPAGRRSVIYDASGPILRNVSLKYRAVNAERDRPKPVP